MTFFSRAQRYGLAVAQGYATADKRITPDAYEENDFCHYADSRQINIPTRASGLPGFSDTLNIDNPFEIDWYRINVPAPGLGDSTLFRIQGRPFVAGRDSSDIDIYVLTVPGSTGPGVTEVGSSVNAGSTENLLLGLGAGSYYVAVVDYAGVAMRYSMCIKQVPFIGSRTCNLILPVCSPVPSWNHLRPPRLTCFVAGTRASDGRRRRLDDGMPQVPHATSGR